MKKLRIILALLVLANGMPARAQIATICANCGSEITQMLNNAQLLTQTADGAQRLATQVSQYVALLQNLNQLPGQVIGAIMSPYATQASDFLRLYNASNSLYNSAVQAQGVLNGTLSSSTAMNLSPAQYMQYIAQQAQNQGGIYRQLLQDNNAKLQSLQQTSAAFTEAAANVPNIQGTQDGLQQVATLAAASGHVATDMLAEQLRANQVVMMQQADDRDTVNRAIQLRQQTTDDLNANLDALGSGLQTNRVWR